MASVQSAMFGSPAFSSPAFDAKAPAEEVVVRGSETSEFSAVAEEDRLNGGRGGVETPSNSAPSYTYEQPAYNTSMHGMYGTPAFVRNQEQVAVAEPAMSGAAVAEASEESLKDRAVDYSLPAYLRNNDMNNNF